MLSAMGMPTGPCYSRKATRTEGTALVSGVYRLLTHRAERGGRSVIAGAFYRTGKIDRTSAPARGSSAEDASQHPADDLAPHGGPDRPVGALGGRLEHRDIASRTAQQTHGNVAQPAACRGRGCGS